MHDFDYACGKRCLDYEWNVLEMDGFAVQQVVCGFVVVLNGTGVYFVQVGLCL